MIDSHSFGHYIQPFLHTQTEGLPRVLGHYKGTHPGPRIICVGGMHGNEPTGIWALKSVLAQLEEMDPDGFAGEFIALTGNRTALDRGERCCKLDFNRVWTAAQVEATVQGEVDFEICEFREQKELLEVLQPLIEEHEREVFVLDLHTTSAHSAPFAVIGDTHRNQKFALQLPVPVLLGLEEHIDGTLTEFCNELGATTIGFEGGQHQDPNSAILHEALIWVTLEYADCLPDELIPKEPHPLQVLERAGRNLPQAIEVHYRHAIAPEDEFFMNPGFANFDRIERGDELAHDRLGVVSSKMDGRILMPLYQGQGDDGFFVGREVDTEELKVWLFLRKLDASRLLYELPGVKQDEEDPFSVHLSKEAQMTIPTKLLRMLGYRKQREHGDEVIVSRRKHEQD